MDIRVQVHDLDKSFEEIKAAVSATKASFYDSVSF